MKSWCWKNTESISNVYEKVLWLGCAWILNFIQLSKGAYGTQNLIRGCLNIYGKENHSKTLSSTRLRRLLNSLNWGQFFANMWTGFTFEETFKIVVNSKKRKFVKSIGVSVYSLGLNRNQAIYRDEGIDALVKVKLKLEVMSLSTRMVEAFVYGDFRNTRTDLCKTLKENDTINMVWQCVKKVTKE